jgi:hypothetical protein
VGQTELASEKAKLLQQIEQVLFLFNLMNKNKFSYIVFYRTKAEFQWERI